MSDTLSCLTIKLKPVTVKDTVNKCPCRTETLTTLHVEADAKSLDEMLGF